MTASLEMFAVQALFQSGVLGLAYADQNQKFTLKQGTLAERLVIGSSISQNITALFGMKEEIASLKHASYSKLSIPCVGFMTQKDASEKVNIDVIWDAKLNGYIVLLSLSEARMQSEERHTSARRVKRIAEETLQFNAQYLFNKGIFAEDFNAMFPSGQSKDDHEPKQAALASAINPLQKLTPREVQVVKLLVQGKSNKIIAHALQISEKTVEATRSRAKKRLGLKTSADLIKTAVEHRLNDIR